MRRPVPVLALLLPFALTLLMLPASASAAAASTPAPTPSATPGYDGPVVQGVFFFSPACGHCERVIREALPGLFAGNGGDPVVTSDQAGPERPSFYLMSNGRLQLLMVDVSQPDGAEMFDADTVRLGLERTGVPRLDIAGTHLVGSVEIPTQLPGIVTAGLGGRGLTWPPVPGLDEALAPFVAEGSVSVVEPDGGGDGVAGALPVGGEEGPLERLGRDPVGNGLAVLVLVGLALSLVTVPTLAARSSLPAAPGWPVLALALAGLVVAAYLAFVETTGNAAVCGPVGDCNAVQQSEHARVLGVPVGVIGVVGYALIGGLWLLARTTRGRRADGALMLIALGALGGTLFSVYLTFLEPFVIGATCMWCITSAVLMMALLWISAGPGFDAWRRQRGRQGPTRGARIGI
jgi:uncharacterized membrane protein